VVVAGGILGQPGDHPLDLFEEQQVAGGEQAVGDVVTYHVDAGRPHW
jgi:hypothetical protein